MLQLIAEMRLFQLQLGYYTFCSKRHIFCVIFTSMNDFVTRTVCLVMLNDKQEAILIAAGLRLMLFMYCACNLFALEETF